MKLLTTCRGNTGAGVNPLQSWRHQVLKSTSIFKNLIQCFALLFWARMQCRSWHNTPKVTRAQRFPKQAWGLWHGQAHALPPYGLLRPEGHMRLVPEWLRKRFPPLRFLHGSGKAQARVGEEMQSTLIFWEQSPSQKQLLRPVSKSNKQLSTACSKYCIGSSLESNLHFADPYKFHLKLKYFSIQLPANISYDKALYISFCVQMQS